MFLDFLLANDFIVLIKVQELSELLFKPSLLPLSQIESLLRVLAVMRTILRHLVRSG
jgi:hypothetical protein